MKTNDPMYIQIYKTMLADIINGQYQSGDFLPSETEMARSFEVDKQTVSRALSLLVEEGFVEKKRGKKAQIKYYEKLNSNQNGIIAMILPDNEHHINKIFEPHISQIYNQLNQICATKGYHLVYSIIRTVEDLSNLRDNSSLVGIIVGSTFENTMLNEIEQLSLPTILLNCKHDRFISVTADLYQSANIALSYLFEKGKRNIAFISGYETYYPTQVALKVYKKLHKKWNIEIDDKQIGFGEWILGSGFDIAMQILNEKNKIDAFFVANDVMAHGVCYALKALKRQVPNDIAVIGINNTDENSTTNMGLTTVAIDRETMVKSTFIIMDRLINGETLNPFNITIPTKLILRQTA